MYNPIRYLHLEPQENRVDHHQWQFFTPPLTRETLHCNSFFNNSFLGFCPTSFLSSCPGTDHQIKYFFTLNGAHCITENRPVFSLTQIVRFWCCLCFYSNLIWRPLDRNTAFWWSVINCDVNTSLTSTISNLTHHFQDIKLRYCDLKLCYVVSKR